MTRPRHEIQCEKCPVMLDRAINVKRAVCSSCRLKYQTGYFTEVRKQAANYRQLLLLLGVKDEGRFFADLRQRAATKGREYEAGKAPCPTCGVVLGVFGFHRLVCAKKTPEQRAWFREHGEWPDPRRVEPEPEDDGVRIWLGGNRERCDRIRQVARDNQDLSLAELVERFGGTMEAMEKLLSRAKIRRNSQTHEPSQIAGNC